MVAQALPDQLQGLRRITERRWEQDRTRVAAFNKIKHFMLARPVVDPATDEKGVLIVDSRKREDGFHLRTMHLSIEPAQIRSTAARAIANQAVLNSMLWIILLLRFGEFHEVPQWATDARGLDIPGMWAPGDLLVNEGPPEHLH